MNASSRTSYHFVNLHVEPVFLVMVLYIIQAYFGYLHVRFLDEKILFLSIIATALLACADNKTKEKAILDDIIKIHDKVMAADDQLMNNKTLLDSMVKYNSTANIKDSVYLYLNKVNLTDSLMGEWMHKFDPEQPGKTGDQKLTLFYQQENGDHVHRFTNERCYQTIG